MTETVRGFLSDIVDLSKMSPMVSDLQARVDMGSMAEAALEEEPPEWSDEWPTLPGRYWFYGVRSKHAEKPQLVVVYARRIRNGFLYVAGNYVIHYSQGARGVWTPLAEPELPTMKGEG